jgi:hypothetical protein
MNGCRQTYRLQQPNLIPYEFHVWPAAAYRRFQCPDSLFHWPVFRTSTDDRFWVSPME